MFARRNRELAADREDGIEREAIRPGQTGALVEGGGMCKIAPPA